MIPIGQKIAGESRIPEIPCSICCKPINLSVDLSADENGKAVHTRCYGKRITTPQAGPSIAMMAD
jgi:hypothetical protein